MLYIAMKLWNLSILIGLIHLCNERTKEGRRAIQHENLFYPTSYIPIWQNVLYYNVWAMWAYIKYILVACLYLKFWTKKTTKMKNKGRTRITRKCHHFKIKPNDYLTLKARASEWTGDALKWRIKRTAGEIWCLLQ